MIDTWLYFNRGIKYRIK